MTKFQLPHIKHDKMLYMLLGILMLLGLAPMMQAYAMIAHIAVCIVTAWLSFNCWRTKKMENMWFLVFALIAILFNPFMIIDLGMQMSMVVKLVFAAMFFYLFYTCGRKEAK